MIDESIQVSHGVRDLPSKHIPVPIRGFQGHRDEGAIHRIPAEFLVYLIFEAAQLKVNNDGINKSVKYKKLTEFSGEYKNLKSS